FRDEHIPERARFPVIDAHNHLWAAWDSVDDVVAVMDQVGVVCYADLTANLVIAWQGGGYAFRQGNLDDFLTHSQRHPGRFYGFTTATFSRPTDQPLFTDARAFVAETLDTLRDHVARGARGLKILKELGLRYRDGEGRLIALDDERLAPVWEEAGRLGVPVLMHQSDPYGFFEPATPDNEHYDTLRRYPTWAFSDPQFPRKLELLQRRDAVLGNHPGTTFILPHVANFPENLGYVSQLLDEHPNVMIDFSARIDELGRQPYRAREFLIRYQERTLFGVDMPASVEMYRCYFRFLETYDEHFIPPDYDGTFGRYRWHIHGLGLPDDVLRSIYYRNAIRVIPGLVDDLAGVLPDEAR
ncbi:MAG: amidohydrolase family protein, partial [Anaerolineales bacterium]|nr:amidohydrolase family protein [Anaerolineales bacterium]